MGIPISILTIVFSIVKSVIYAIHGFRAPSNHLKFLALRNSGSRVDGLRKHTFWTEYVCGPTELVVGDMSPPLS